MEQLRVGLGEYDTGWHDPATSWTRAREQALHARVNGAGLLVLPEMCTSGFTMDAAGHAERPDGPSVRALSSIAADCNIWIVAGIPMHRDGKFFNSALAFSPDGSVAATYDKRRLFNYAKETEVYSPGSASCVIEVDGVSLALFICFELRFPELFRDAGEQADAFVIIANWPATRQRHWDVLTRARAIENQCYVIAVNRTGEADGLSYAGGSVILNPQGERIDTQTANSPLRTGTISHAVVEQTRRTFPFLSSAGL